MNQENAGYGDNQKLLHQGSGTIPALADEELLGEDDDYDDLYSDVNVGESFFQAHNQPQAPVQVGGSILAQNSNVSEPRMAVVSGGGAVEGKYHNGISGPETRSDAYPQGSSFGPKGMNVDVQSNQPNKVNPQGSTSIVLNTHSFSGSAVNVPEPPPVHNNPYGGAPQGAQQIPVSQTSVNPSAMVNRSPTQPFVVDNGNTMLFVGELHWWTTDAEIESVLSQYGRVKEIKFFDERVSGKSKGYCQVEFYDSAAAAACKEGMNGFVFNGKACVVAFASPETLKQMGANFTGRNQGQNQMQNRRPLNEGMGRGNNNNNNMNTQNGDGGRNYGRGGGFARGGQGMANRGGHWGGAARGRGMNNMANGAGAGPYGGPGLAGPAFGGMMHPQGMMGAGGFDPTFMGRGGGYGGFPGLAYPGMPQPYPGVNPMGMVGIAPHVNPAFFGGAGMGTMGNAGMNGVHAGGMWNEASGGGGGGGGEEGGSEYGGYEDENQEKEEKPSREKERATAERDWSESSGGDRRHKSHREEKDSHREYKHRDSEEYDRGQSSSKSRSRSRMSEDDHRSRSRDADYGKRRRGD
ncbi:hypothetical protein F2Q69_00026446 [Brassica cretica]|uniref:RRM domain-containing protein n=2 Tax=Brassica TaxID=3705 RepID=A0A8S9S0M2_BRACR|nr:hypothetical protein F2Q69_00026446 [Brassica cretica]